jgi:hypothetical protein
VRPAPICASGPPRSSPNDWPSSKRWPPFEAETGIEVEVIPVSESDLGTRATAAYAAGDLPDVIYHTLQYALPWYEAGILDAGAATDVVEASGRETFAPGALAMAAVDEGYRLRPGRWLDADDRLPQRICSTRPGWSRRPPMPTCGRG